MFVGEVADEGRGNGLEEGVERAEGAAKEDNVVAGVDGLGEGRLVGVEAAEDAGEEGVVGIGTSFGVAVELEELGEEGEDEGEGYLERERGGCVSVSQVCLLRVDWEGETGWTYQVKQQGDEDDLEHLLAGAGVNCSHRDDVRGGSARVVRRVARRRED